MGLVWGQGKWLTTSWVGTLISDGAATASGGVTPKSRLERDVRCPLKGTVRATPPPYTIYPNLIVVNGTQYRGGGAGNLIYKDVVGALLSLTEFREWLSTSGS